MIAGLEPYPAMKDSGVSWLEQVPEHWEVKRLRHISRTPIRNGVGESAQTFRQDWPRYIRITDIVGPRRLKDSGKASIPPEFIQLAPVEKGDLLLAAVGATYGKAYLYNSTAEPACFAGYLVKWSPSEEVVPEWASYWAESAAYWNQVHCGVIKSTIENFSASRYRGLGLALPPLPEQASIVRFLDYADRRIRRYIGIKQKLIKLLEEQKQAIIHRAVTSGLDPNVHLKPSGVEWLGDVPEHWEVRRLGRVARVFNGTTPGRMKPDYWISGTIPWLSSGKVNDYIVETASELVTEKALRECSLSMVPKGSVIVGLVGQGKTRAKSAILGIDACINQNLAAVVPSCELMGHFLLHFLTAFYATFREFGRGGNQEALNCEIVGNWRIPVPPENEQKAISDYLNDELLGLHEAESRINQEQNLLREYRARLIADVVTGKLDVREAAAQLPDETEDTDSLDDFEPESVDEEAAADSPEDALEDAEA